MKKTILVIHGETVRHLNHVALGRVRGAGGFPDTEVKAECGSLQCDPTDGCGGSGTNTIYPDCPPMTTF